MGRKETKNYTNREKRLTEMETENSWQTVNLIKSREQHSNFQIRKENLRMTLRNAMSFMSNVPLQSAFASLKLFKHLAAILSYNNPLGVKLKMTASLRKAMLKRFQLLLLIMFAT